MFPSISPYAPFNTHLRLINDISPPLPLQHRHYAEYFFQSRKALPLSFYLFISISGLICVYFLLYICFVCFTAPYSSAVLIHPLSSPPIFAVAVITGIFPADSTFLLHFIFSSYNHASIYIH